MKAVVLARGLARRMREAEAAARLEPAQARAAASGHKSMMPVGGSQAGAARPFLDYVLSSLADAGCSHVALVIGPEHEEIQRRYGTSVPLTRLALDFVLQSEPLGTANAVLSAEAWTARDPFLVVNADNLYPVDVLRALTQLDEPGLPVFRPQALVDSHIPADRIASFALVEVDDRGYLTAIVEKPDPSLVAAAGDRALVSMNCWRFDDRVFGACRDVPRSTRGEFELPQAVGLAVDRGVRFATVSGHGPVLDLSRQSDVAAVSSQLAGQEPRL